ncbi:hypothetical protein VKT23_006668 [Stygiomarasmius scandens]|uniref:Uncharacterized protein n=1 Tax=Marasmiellus scandens TaxID=2682957 RepID=A0ABR1JP97_9AGAR
MAISFSVHSSREDRPVLPPLHTLALPTFPAQTRLPGVHALNATHDPDSRPRLSSPFVHHQPTQRQCSISSSTSSRTPSPSPSDSSSSASTSAFPSTPFTPLTPGSSAGRSKMRLIPSTLEDADAVVVVPPQSFYDESNPTASLLDAKASGKGKALLLVGPALRHLRHPQRQIAKGARIHPYKIERTAAKGRVQPQQDGYFAYAPNHNNRRRTSTSSTSTDLSAEDDVSEDVRMLSL